MGFRFSMFASRAFWSRVCLLIIVRAELVRGCRGDHRLSEWHNFKSPIAKKDLVKTKCKAQTNDLKERPTC